MVEVRQRRELRPGPCWSPGVFFGRILPPSPSPEPRAQCRDARPPPSRLPATARGATWPFSTGGWKAARSRTSRAICPPRASSRCRNRNCGVCCAAPARRPRPARKRKRAGSICCARSASGRAFRQGHRRRQSRHRPRAGHHGPPRQTVSRAADRARDRRIRKRPKGPAGKAQRDRGATFAPELCA